MFKLFKKKRKISTSASNEAAYTKATQSKPAEMHEEMPDDKSAEMKEETLNDITYIIEMKHSVNEAGQQYEVLSEPQPLFSWKDRDEHDDYAYEGVRYKYLSSEHRLYSTYYHGVEPGFGSGNQNVTTEPCIVTWDKLLADMKVHSGRFNKETWEIVCADAEKHRDMETEDFKELKKHVNERVLA